MTSPDTPCARCGYSRATHDLESHSRETGCTEYVAPATEPKRWPRDGDGNYPCESMTNEEINAARPVAPAPAPHVHRCELAGYHKGSVQNHTEPCVCECGAIRRLTGSWAGTWTLPAPTEEAAPPTDGLNPEVRRALEDARHSLVTLCGLHASDNLSIYSDAMSSGCDPSGAWDVFTDSMFQIDETQTIARIDAVLAQGDGYGDIAAADHPIAGTIDLMMRLRESLAPQGGGSNPVSREGWRDECPYCSHKLSLHFEGGTHFCLVAGCPCTRYIATIRPQALASVAGPLAVPASAVTEVAACIGGRQVIGRGATLDEAMADVRRQSGGVPFAAYQRPAAPTGERCDTTQTLRAPRTDCGCPTYAENLGPCSDWIEGINGRCAYCDHRKECGHATGEPSFEKLMDAFGALQWNRALGNDAARAAVVESHQESIIAVARHVGDLEMKLGQLRSENAALREQVLTPRQAAFVLRVIPAWCEPGENAETVSALRRIARGESE